MPATPTVDPARLADLRNLIKEDAEQAAENSGDASTLDVERYLRLAEFAVAHAHHHATTGEETSEQMFGFLFTALALLEPDGGTHYDVGHGEYSGLAFDAIRAITEYDR
jgi:hypothetical protein